MLARQLETQENQFDIEMTLKRMKSIQVKIKTLEAEWNMLKKDAVENYLDENEEYVNAKGLTLATYKSYETSNFNTTQFKKDHFNLYSSYLETKTLKKFLLK